MAAARSWGRSILGTVTRAGPRTCGMSCEVVAALEVADAEVGVGLVAVQDAAGGGEDGIARGDGGPA